MTAEVFDSWIGFDLSVVGRGEARMVAASGKVTGAAAALEPRGGARFALPPRRFEVLTVRRRLGRVWVTASCAYLGSSPGGLIEVGPGVVEVAEHHHDEKLAVPVPVEVSWLDGALPLGVTGSADQLSMTGLAVALVEPPPVLRLVSVQLDLGADGLLPVLGYSLGPGPGGSWRVSFLSQSPVANERLRGFIARVRIRSSISISAGAAPADDRAWLWSSSGIQAAVVESLSPQGVNLSVATAPARGEPVVVAIVGSDPRAARVVSLAGGLVRLGYDD
jgi:hypothetical protein